VPVSSSIHDVLTFYCMDDELLVAHHLFKADPMGLFLPIGTVIIFLEECCEDRSLVECEIAKNGHEKSPGFGAGVPERGRTSDLQIRNLSLYPLSYGYIYLLSHLRVYQNYARAVK
jgi:hypothetical protein